MNGIYKIVFCDKDGYDEIVAEFKSERKAMSFAKKWNKDKTMSNCSVEYYEPNSLDNKPHDIIYYTTITWNTGYEAIDEAFDDFFEEIKEYADEHIDKRVGDYNKIEPIDSRLDIYGYNEVHFEARSLGGLKKIMRQFVKDYKKGENYDMRILS